MASPKIVVLGSLNGQLQPALAKLATLHSKNHFSFALLLGDVFADENDSTAADLIAGKIAVPLPTYFTVGTDKLPPAVVAKIEADEDICENLHFLGKRSVTKTSEGIRIAVLAGKLDTDIVGGVSKEAYLPYHTADDEKALKGANSADLLITTLWPDGVWTGSRAGLGSETTEIPKSEGIAELVVALKPRYHFAVSPGAFFYEREPFFHPEKDKSGNECVTRFISMAPYGNSEKAKAMYAFTLPAPSAVMEVPLGSTASPFLARAPTKKRPPPDDGEYYSRFGNSKEHRHHRDGRSDKRRRQRAPPPGPDQCYFCLSNPNLPTHMVCSIGEESYIVTAKGPLPTPTTWKSNGLAFPCHMLLVPLPHEATFRAMAVSEDAGSGQRTHTELARFRESLQAMVSQVSKHQLGAVTWEISRQRNIHLHWQFMPVPYDLVHRGLVEAAFKVEAENLKFPPFTVQELSLEEELDGSLGDYLRVWIWGDDGEVRIKGKCLIMRLQPEDYFDLQFARRVMAKLLGLEERLMWQDVVQSEEEETKDVLAFREAFKQWDFTLRE